MAGSCTKTMPGNLGHMVSLLRTVVESRDDEHEEDGDGVCGVGACKLPLDNVKVMNWVVKQ